MTSFLKLQSSGFVDSVLLEDGAFLQKLISSTKVIHIYGAGLNSEKPAHTAVKELSERDWAIAPIHPRDAGATIEGFPIRPHLDDGVVPEIVVLFLAPDRARSVVRNLILRYEVEVFPLVWFQHGAEDEDSIAALDEMGVNYVMDDCIVRFSERNNLKCSNSILPQTWCLQTASADGDGCSVWSVHSTDSAKFGRPAEALEWVGTLDELAISETTIPKYIRSLKQEQESLLTLATRLSN